MFKVPNSILSFIFSFVGVAILLDYLLWPRTIKVNETLEQEIQIKIIAGFVFLLFSFYFRSKAKIHEKNNGWLNASRIINIVVISIIVLSYLFYMYTEINR